ncbi:MAG: M23 family metallopeptidase, partial [Bacteroidota bacterium]
MAVVLTAVVGISSFDGVPADGRETPSDRETRRLALPMRVEAVYKRFGCPLGDPSPDLARLRLRPSVHLGLDLRGDQDAPVFASAPGEVVFVHHDDLFVQSGGTNSASPRVYASCVIRGDGKDALEIGYVHLESSSIAVRVGDWVETGDYLGDLTRSYVRRHPPHLHLSVARSGGARVQLVGDRRQSMGRYSSSDYVNPELRLVELTDASRPRVSNAVLRKVEPGAPLAPESLNGRARTEYEIDIDVVECVTPEHSTHRYAVVPHSVEV